MDLTSLQPLLIALAVPVFTLVTAIATRDRDPALYRRLRHSVAALSESPDGSEARAALDALVVAQAERLSGRETSAKSRKLNPANLALAVILSLLFAAILWGLLTWLFAAWGGPWGWVPVVITIIVGLFGILFVWFAYAQIYDPPRPRAKS